MNAQTADFRVSVIVPAYNAAKYLAETLDTVLAQTVPAHEILLIDDGSTDDTPAVAARYEGRITYIRRENRGVSAARNFAIGRATGNWIAFLDSDDLWEKPFIERVQPVCMSEPRPALVLTDYRTFGTANQEVRTSEVFAKWNPAIDVLAPAVTVMPSASLVPTDTPIRFPEWAKNDEDAIFFNEVSELGPVRCVPEILMNYRKHPDSVMAKSRNELIGVENLLRWAKSREAEKPGTVQRLMHSLATRLVNVRWRRNWEWYWKLRGFCIANWPAGVPQPPILTERIWPPIVYRVKDTLDRLRRGKGKGAPA
jgi:glycosyltransferase involved in cell wall biosynthesis